MLISLVSGNIPHSYYNINSNNNIIYYIENSTTKTLTITSKNYNVNDLVSYLNSNWTNFTTTYTSSTNKFTFTNSTYDFTILSTSSTLGLLGLSKANHTSTSKALTSDISVDLSYTKALYVHINLSLNAVDSRNLTTSNILAVIHIEENFLGLENYYNDANIKHIIYDDKITVLRYQ